MKKLYEAKLFKDITKEELERMLHCSKAQIKEKKVGEYLFEQGQKPSKLFLLIQGQIHICKDFSSGKRTVLYLVDEGNVFGEMFLFGSKDKYWYDAVGVLLPFLF